MKYLVLHSFRSFGVTLHKGEVVDEVAIRSPRLRRSEGKIIPAVSSSPVPEEVDVAAQPSQVTGTKEGSDSKNTTPTEKPAATKLSFGKK